MRSFWSGGVMVSDRLQPMMISGRVCLGSSCLALETQYTRNRVRISHLSQRKCTLSIPLWVRCISYCAAHQVPRAIISSANFADEIMAEVVRMRMPPEPWYVAQKCWIPTLFATFGQRTDANASRSVTCDVSQATNTWVKQPPREPSYRSEELGYV